MRTVIAVGFGFALACSAGEALAEDAAPTTTPVAAPAPSAPIATPPAPLPPAATPVTASPAQPAYAPNAGYGGPGYGEGAPPLASPRGRSHGFYARAAALGVAYAHVSVYPDAPDGSSATQTDAGYGYEFLLMLGGALRENFVLGGAIGVENVPSASVSFGNGAFGTASGSILTLVVGPSVDYFPVRRLHVGGLLGYANEKLPPLAMNPDLSRHVSGYTGSVWVGYDWDLEDGLGLGVMLHGQFIDGVPRDAFESGQTAEDAFSLGVGVSVVYF